MAIPQKRHSPVIEIDLDDQGMGSVKIDGHEIAGATSKTTVHIEAEAGESPTVNLDLWAHNLKVRMPATVIAEIREAYTIDDEMENRIVERVLDALRIDPSQVAAQVAAILKRQSNSR